MTKNDLVNMIKEELFKGEKNNEKSFTSKDILNIIDLLIKVIKKSLLNKEKIELRGFGTFFLKIRKSKNAINPRTKEKVKVNTHYVACFKPGIELKNQLKEIKI